MSTSTSNTEQKTEIQGLDAGVQNDFINLKCRDGVTVPVHRRACRLSALFRGFLETQSCATEHEVKQIDSEIMKLIVEYLEHYRFDDPKILEPPLATPDLKDHVPEWDCKFIAYDAPEQMKTFLTLLNAANFLGITALTRLCCAKFATFLKTKNVEQLKELLGVKVTLTPKEENEIRAKYPQYFAWLKPPQDAKVESKEEAKVESKEEAKVESKEDDD